MNEKQVEFAIRMQAERLYEKGCKALNIPVKPFKFDFSLRGRCAGQFVHNVFTGTTLRFNLPVALKNYDRFMKQTVGHEVAHVLVHEKYDYNNKNVRSHGHQWKFVMSRIFGLEPAIYHNMDVEPARKTASYSYSCACRTVSFGARRHAKVQNGDGYYKCANCRTRFKFTP